MNKYWVATKNPKYFRFRCRQCGFWKNTPKDTKRKNFVNGFCRGVCERMFLKADFYRTREWRELRMKALIKYGRRCACCGTTQSVMHVDHIKPRSKHPDLALEIGNLQILCEVCNHGKGAWDQTSWKHPI